MFNPEFFVAVGFAVFVGVLIYVGAHKRLNATLDGRAQKIKDELGEAERLRKEAADILASFERKRADAEKEAEAIVQQAHAEAEMLAKDAEERLGDYVKRRTAQAETKIASAETQALAQVRATAADAAAAAAETILKGQTKQDGLADRLIEKSIGDVTRLAH